MMRPLTKYTRQVNHGVHVPAIVREAFRLASEERPGAAHIELPEDIAAEMVDDAHIFDVVDQRIPAAADDVIDNAATMLRRAKRPLLLIGAGANRKRASAALSRFVETTRIPFSILRWAKASLMSATPSIWARRPCPTTIFYTRPSPRRT